MIPTLLLFGLVFGRWWKATIAVGVVGWVVVIVVLPAGGVATGTAEPAWVALGAAVLGFVGESAGLRGADA